MDSRILPLARGYFSAEVLGSLYDVTHTLLKGFPGGSDGKESACGAGDLGLIPGSGRSPGEGKGYPLQYLGLENSMDHVVHGLSKSRTERLSVHCSIALRQFTNLELLSTVYH